MYLDRVKIFIKAGNGGNGKTSFHTEKYVEKGGPDGGDGGHADELGNCLVQVHAEDETECAAAHASCRFDLTGMDVGESRFHLTGEEGNRTEDERDDRASYLDRRSDDGTGEGDEEDEQNEERDRTENIDEKIHDEEDHAVFLDAVLFCDGEDDTEHDAEDEGEDPRDEEHLQGGDATAPEFIAVIDHVGDEFFKNLHHARSPPI